MYTHTNSKKKEGKPGVFIPGLGAVVTGLAAGFESSQTAPGLRPEHGTFKQSIKLQNTLRHPPGEGLITHPGLTYYQDTIETL